MIDKQQSEYEFANITVYENSEKYVITNDLIASENHSKNMNDDHKKRMFLVFSKIKGTGEILAIKDEFDNINHNGSLDKDVSHVNGDSYLDHFFKSNIFHKTYQICAIYGLITLENNTYLIFITEVEPIGQIDNQIIYKIKQVEIKELLVTQPNNSYLLKRAKDFFKHDGIYYSTYNLYSNIAYDHANMSEYEFMFNFNLMKSFLQLFEKETVSSSSYFQQEEISVEKMSNLTHVSLPQPEDLLRKYSFLSHFIAKSIFGSYEEFTICDHPQCFRIKSCLLHCASYVQISKEKQEKFLYGMSLDKKSDAFLGIKKQGQRDLFPNKQNIHGIATNPGSKFHGMNIPAPISPIDPSFTVHLLSRRSHNNMGARYLRRGIRDGFPANSVETEQLIQINFLVNENFEKNHLKSDSASNFSSGTQKNIDFQNVHRSRGHCDQKKSHLENKDSKIDHMTGKNIPNSTNTSRLDDLTSPPTLLNIRSVVLSSFLQLRGSIPLCWKQELSFKYTPNIKIIKSYEPLTTYNSHILKNYRSVFYLNLIKSSGYESAINLFYCKSLQDNNLKYLHYDFNKEGLHFSKKKKRELLSLLRPLLKRNKHKMMICNQNDQNYYKTNTHFDSSTNEVYNKSQGLFSTTLTFQQGIIRTNCIDSLDRTNIVQYFISEEMIQEQICAIVGNHGKIKKRPVSHICQDDVYLISKGHHFITDGSPSMSLLEQCLTNETFHQKHKSLWIKNGHRLSQQYSGTNSLHSSAVAQLHKEVPITDNFSNNNSSSSTSSIAPDKSVDNSKYILARTLANDNLIERYSISFLSHRLKDLRCSIERYFKNRFMHGDLQTSYDIITGSNMQMYRRKSRSFSFFHSFVCCTSVLFYMYYFLFYYGQDYTNTGYNTINSSYSNNMNNLSEEGLNGGKPANVIRSSLSDINNTSAWIYSEETHRNILAFKDKIEPYLNGKIRSIISGIVHKWEYYQMSSRVRRIFILLQSLIPITCYDAILISILSTIITLILYFFVLGNCFNLPFYE